MNKFKIIMLVLVISLTPVLAFASDVVPGAAGSSLDVPATPCETSIDTSGIESKLDEVIGILSTTPTEGTLEIREPDTTVQVLRISANDTTGLHSVILSLIGDYNPIVKDYTYQSTQGYTSHSIDIQPDWSWIASACIFLIVVYSVFRIIGVALGAIRG